MKTQLHIKTGDLLFIAAWEEEKAPKTCAAIRKLLPLREKLLQTRWSGEAAWVSIDHLPLDIESENATIHPSKGELLVYPGFVSVKEIVIPYGATAFGSPKGPLEGNHFATIIHGQEHLEELGRRVLWEGAQSIEFTETTP